MKHEQNVVVMGHIPIVATQLLEQAFGRLAHVHTVSQRDVNLMRVIHSAEPGAG
jgi:hypothetical protein